ncbi:MAG: TraR/DksA C4-type zinc finger protein, partial [Actinomycetes bacterium]
KAPVAKAAAKKAQPTPKAIKVEVVVEEPAKPVAKRIVPTISANKPKKQLAPNGKPLVREDESPWSAAELKEVRVALKGDISRLEEELVNAEIGLADLIRDSGEGAGDDQADAGSKTFEREHEMSLANNAREMLLQVNHAIARLDNGTYGACEACGKPIGKYRLQAFPRATLCLVCKQAEERLML